jgi:hypothetical protein
MGQPGAKEGFTPFEFKDTMPCVGGPCERFQTGFLDEGKRRRLNTFSSCRLYFNKFKTASELSRKLASSLNGSFINTS